MKAYTVEQECGYDAHWSIVGDGDTQPEAVLRCRRYAAHCRSQAHRVQSVATGETVFAMRPQAWELAAYNDWKGR